MRIANLTLITFAVFTFIFSCAKQDAIKIACVGDSITYGSGIKGRDSLAYPPQLNKLLGDKYLVKNYGISARTLLSKGDFPYINEQVYKDALAWEPNIVLIKLGTNDTKPHNWQHGDEYKNDYIRLIKSFQDLDSHPKVILIKPVPAFQTIWGISDTVIVDEIIPTIDEISKEMNLQTMDLHYPMLNDSTLFPDHIHPNAKGAAKMAKIIYEQIK
ncbi:MAG: GDSL-type esterase/lipase family protein [Bacteroidales bacterium]